MSRYAVAGCKISIGGVLADKSIDFVAADFTSQTWAPINEWQTMGDDRDEAADIATQLIGEGREKHAKGTFNAATTDHVFSYDPADPGQIALKVAAGTRFNYAFKVELNDKPAVGSAPTNTVFFFIALVMSAGHVGGGANTIRTLRSTLQRNSNLVEVLASAGS